MQLAIMMVVFIEEFLDACELSCGQCDGLLDGAHDALHLLEVLVQAVRIRLLLVNVELQRLRTFETRLLVEIKEALHFVTGFSGELRVLVYQFVAFRSGNALLLELPKSVLQSDQLLISSF